MFISITFGFTILCIVDAINIDNELRVTKIDCYERIAIGQRLNSSNIYKIFKYKTVNECKKECSEENAACKSFSFGISVKGNGSCELGSITIKETGDLKPAGTVSDVDFDLYIKKTGCTVVSDEFPYRKPPLEDKFLINNIHDGVQKVQTIVSVASGPQSVLNPIHGILVSPDNMKVNIWDTTNDWYKEIRKIYPNYYDSYNFGSDNNFDLYHYAQPTNVPYKDISRYDNEFHYTRNNNKVPTNAYNPKSDYRLYPTPHKYGSVIPHPNNYYERPTHHDYPYPSYKPSNKPESNGYQYDRPQRPYQPHQQHQPHQPNYHSKPVSSSFIYEIDSNNQPISESTPPKKINSVSNSTGSKRPENTFSKPIVTHSKGYNGMQITSIITEIKDVDCDPTSWIPDVVSSGNYITISAGFWGLTYNRSVPDAPNNVYCLPLTDIMLYLEFIEMTLDNVQLSSSSDELYQ
ncbi:uncharacterized protein LOC130902222 [Diorhabda carinulata]|uniref:uncharacterized protein LOC130902222 n=1 Tax=Diorhabda carinulata TaxID=1163345 RepID=UPI0025A09B05|nr:uncharacterized protein LOC130902222 [Diorhabda carinulata]